MITIILTSTVYVNYKKICLVQTNPSERLQTYLKSIHQWLRKTQFHIILVENSGYTFPELENEKILYKHRFEVITLNETNEPSSSRFNISKGSSEIFSINYAFKKSSMIQNSSFIIKITARFFIPELEEYLNQYDLDAYDSLTQHDKDRCEMVGCHYNMFTTIFNIYMFDIKKYNGHIEDLWKLRTSKCKNVFVCKPLYIEPTVRGGMNEVYTVI